MSRSSSLPPDAVGRQGSGESPTALTTLSPHRRRNAPLHQRIPTKRRTNHYTSLPGGSAICESLTFPSEPDCFLCHRQLEEGVPMRWGCGLCEECFGTCPKDCSICKRKLPKQQLMWGSGLCNVCYDSCDKQCRLCANDLALDQLHWNTGLCDSCYNTTEKECMMCSDLLPGQQLRWGTGLCNNCYDDVKKQCRICEKRIENRQLRWNSGLCDMCYDHLEKTCSRCSEKIALGSLHWRTNLCDACYDFDKSDKTCQMCRAPTTAKDRHTGLCAACYEKADKTCAMCKAEIDAKSSHWGTGLCDKCHDTCDKICKICKAEVPFGERRWGSGLCNSCYDTLERTCHGCKAKLSLGQLHWGTGLCDPCFDKCEKVCRSCNCAVPLGQIHWGTGYCDNCYDMKRSHPHGLSRGVQAVIGAQFVFYVAPGVLQPSLYLQIQKASFGPSPAAVFAAVLTTASIASMIAPVPLGIWADRWGEREVYVAVTLGSTLGALLLMRATSAPLFALAWALVNTPPSIRGVRAAYFARHVVPEDLSRAGQLASSWGLLGGFLGPLLSIVANRFFGAPGSEAAAGSSFALGLPEGDEDRWPDGFTATALASAVVYLACAAWLAWALPPKKAKPPSTTGKGGSAPPLETCELCQSVLRPNESVHKLSLCDGCYQGFGGPNYTFKLYSRHLLVGFCIVSALLEISMNAGVIATFQPIAVTHFAWGNDAIAAVNFVGAGLSVVISTVMAHLRLRERFQMAVAASLYLTGVLVYTLPPLSEWRLVLGLMLGIKAQILFMAPFTAIFSRLIGRARVTNTLTTLLCVAPAVGMALGTAMAPAFVATVGTPTFSLAAVPAATAVVCIMWGWRRLDHVPRPRQTRDYAGGDTGGTGNRPTAPNSPRQREHCQA